MAPELLSPTERAERLKSHWLSQEIRIRPALAPEVIDAWESEQHTHLPEDMRAYFATVDGMEATCLDYSMYNFWPLERVVSLGKTFAGNPSGLDDPDSWYVFAEVFIDAFHYAIYLPDGDSGTRHPVTWIDSNTYEVLSQSFTGFVDRYLEDPESLVVPQEEVRQDSRLPLPVSARERRARRRSTGWIRTEGKRPR